VAGSQSAFSLVLNEADIAPSMIQQLALRSASRCSILSLASHSHLVGLLRATAATAVARLSHRNSVCLSVRLSVTRVDQLKTVQARIAKSSPRAAWKTLVSGSVKLFHKFEKGHLERGS